MKFYYEGQVLWAQIDANQHLRHSAYADFGAQARLSLLNNLGLAASVLYGHKIGPVLFREELIYLREVGINDYVKVTCEVIKSRPDGSRWTMRHEIYRGDGVKAAVITVEGAWIDMEKRKLTLLPPELSDLYAQAPKSSDYIEEIKKV
jgi:acyl-CoA thioester hydrolase